MKKILLLILLTGCSQNAPEAFPVIVNVPVSGSCKLETIVEPEWNVPHLKKTASPPEKLKAILADLDLSKGYIEELHAQIAACL